MELAEGIEGLEQLVDDEASHVNVMVAAEADDDVPILQRLTLGDAAVEEFRDSAWRSVPDLDGDTVLKEYEPTYKPYSHELLYIDLEEAPRVAEIVELASSVAQAEEFAEDDDMLAHLRFYGIVIGPASGNAVFFRNYSPKKELSRRGGFAIVKRRGQYNRVTERIFLFDNQVDCFAWNGHMFIWNVHQFQRMFRYFEELRERAIETIATVTARVPISNADEFTVACTGQMQMLAKLSAISRKWYLPDLTMDAIRRTIDECGLEVQIVNENGEDKLLFEPAAEKRWLILKLLDDDYLLSIMTEGKYEANSKSRL
jgi:hypothetical protein